MTRYEQGFMNKCAEYGVDGEALLKAAWVGPPPGYRGDPVMGQLVKLITAPKRGLDALVSGVRNGAKNVASRAGTVLHPERARFAGSTFTGSDATAIAKKLMKRHGKLSTKGKNAFDRLLKHDPYVRAGHVPAYLIEDFARRGITDKPNTVAKLVRDTAAARRNTGTIFSDAFK